MALSTEMLLENEPQLSPRTRKHLQMIQQATGDVAKTVARMKDFYRQREPQLKLSPVHLNALVQQVVDLTRARWSDMPQQQGVVIEMRTEFAPDLPAIMGVESEIREALINLIFNAVDAMRCGSDTRPAGNYIPRCFFLRLLQDCDPASFSRYGRTTLARKQFEWRSPQTRGAVAKSGLARMPRHTEQSCPVTLRAKKRCGNRRGSSESLLIRAQLSSIRNGAAHCSRPTF
jgi:hypothetical protein